MADENNRGAGYEVLDLRLKHAEKEIEELKREIKQLSKDNAKGFNEVHDRIDKLNEFTIEVKLMMSNYTSSQTAMREDIKGIAASAGKDQGWRALLTDLIKAAILIIGFFATGKWLG